MRVAIRFVDGTVLHAAPEDWAALPSEGVDWVEVETGDGRTRISGQSVYWLYAEGRTWVAGGGPVGYGSAPPEVVVEGERQSSRAITFMPDLPCNAVKLGHWWPDEPQRPVV